MRKAAFQSRSSNSNDSKLASRSYESVPSDAMTRQ